MLNFFIIYKYVELFKIIVEIYTRKYFYPIKILSFLLSIEYQC